MALAEQGIKVSQAEASYRQGNAEQSCANCKNYLPPDSCMVVQGLVSSSGLSDLWEPKTMEAEGPSPEEAMMQLFPSGGMSLG